MIPPLLFHQPFRADTAVSRGWLTRRQLQSSEWVRLFPGVFLRAGKELTYDRRCIAAHLFLNGRGVVGGRSAAYLWGADILPSGEATVEVTVLPHTRIADLDGLRVVRSPLVRGDVERLPRLRGLLTTSRRRTAFDLARRLPFVEAVVAVDAMLGNVLISLDQLERLARERAGWPGLPQVWRVLAAAEPRSESPMETRLRLVIVGGGLPRPVAQYEVVDEAGHKAGRVDLAYPEKRIGIEYEGAYHRETDAFQTDLRRMNRLRAAGWTMLRFGPADVFQAPDNIVQQIRRMLES